MRHREGTHDIYHKPGHEGATANPPYQQGAEGIYAPEQPASQVSNATITMVDLERGERIIDRNPLPVTLSGDLGNRSDVMNYPKPHGDDVWLGGMTLAEIARRKGIPIN